MSIRLHGIETLVPETVYHRSEASETMQALTESAAEKRRIRALHRASGIDRRHSVLGELTGGVAPFLTRDPQGRIREPGTAERNRRYTEASHRMLPVLGRRALAASGFAPEEITHVITVSCTGFYNPGPDFVLVRELGLPTTTKRYNLGFMGCYAAFPALSMARQFCKADAQAVVLVVCLELCSLHLNLREGEDNLLGNALFADGGAATVVSRKAPRTPGPHLVLDQLASDLVPEGEESMAWTLGDQGFEIALSSYVPKILGSRIAELVDGQLSRGGLNRSDIRHWAIHPGGRAILDKIDESLSLPPEALGPSREILREYGNMSSATILFVLRRMLHAATPDNRGERILAMAFGPGLSVESALLRLR